MLVNVACANMTHSWLRSISHGNATSLKWLSNRRQPFAQQIAFSVLSQRCELSTCPVSTGNVPTYFFFKTLATPTPLKITDFCQRCIVKAVIGYLSFEDYFSVTTQWMSRDIDVFCLKIFERSPLVPRCIQRASVKGKLLRCPRLHFWCKGLSCDSPLDDRNHLQ